MMMRFAAIFSLCLTTLGAAQSDMPRSEENRSGQTIEGVTTPSHRLNLPFFSAGIVSEWKARPGDAVKKDQVLVSQDDRIERKQLEAYRMLAESMSKVEAAKAELDMERALLHAKESEGEGAFSTEELLVQRAKVAIGEKKVVLEEESQREARIKSEMQALKVELMELKSPIDGHVDRINVGPGEMADPGKPDGAVIVVRNDPLHIDIHLPIEQTQALSLGDVMKVRYTLGSSPATDAKVIFISPEANNDTQAVRLEWPNPTDRHSGLPVIVEVPQRMTAASAK